MNYPGIWAQDEFGRPELRWSAGFLLVASIFAGALWLSLHWHRNLSAPQAAPPAAIMIDLAPLPSAPAAPQTAALPGPRQQVSAPPQPMLKLPDAPPSPAPSPAVVVPPKPKKLPLPHRIIISHLREMPVPHKTLPATQTSAPPQAQSTAVPAAAPPASNAMPAPPSNAVPSWQALLMGRLEQFKHYPAAAQNRDEQGVVFLRFTMNRDGAVLSASIARSSGYDDLDAETLALIRRAAPLPKPPPEIPGNAITLTVPVQFFMQNSD